LAALRAETEQLRADIYDVAKAESSVSRRIKLVAEGDSWFRYTPAYDVLVQLRKRVWSGWQYEIAHRASAGDTLNDMVYGREMAETYQLLQEHKPEAFLFSGGGNDIAGQELFVMLYHKRAVRTGGAGQPLNYGVLQGLVREVFLQAYLDVVDLVRAKSAGFGRPELPIIVHGYAHAIPDGRGWAGGWGPLPGPWLDPSLTRKGYDRTADAAQRRDVVRQLIDEFYLMLNEVARLRPGVFVTDLRPVLTDGDWGNELHPTKEGFRKVTEAIEGNLRRALTI
jgi:hypothetical protein